jgi:hypothetical protein
MKGDRYINQQKQDTSMKVMHFTKATGREETPKWSFFRGPGR